MVVEEFSGKQHMVLGIRPEQPNLRNHITLKWARA
jgi:hypothetical protein